MMTVKRTGIEKTFDLCGFKRQRPLSAVAVTVLLLTVLLGITGCVTQKPVPGENAAAEKTVAEKTVAEKTGAEKVTEEVKEGFVKDKDTATAHTGNDPEAVKDGETDGNGSKTRFVTDHAGNKVEVPCEINNIVIADIYPMASILCLFFDSADKIKGVAAPIKAAAENGLLGELYPSLLRAETGFINGTDVNLEELMKLKPDVVFYSAGSKEEGELYKNAGIPAIAVSPGKWGFDAVETLDQWVKLLDELFPANSKAEAVSAYSRAKNEFVKKRLENLKEEDKKKAFFLFQYSDTTLMTSGGKHFGQWWCDAAGLLNAASELSEQGTVPVNMEQVYEWNPDIIFITNFTTAYPENLYGNTTGSYDWSGVTAVQNRCVYKMPLGIYRSYTCGADTPVTLLWMAKTAYPELFEDVDIRRETRRYYGEVFGIDLTDAQADRIFAPEAKAGKVLAPAVK